MLVRACGVMPVRGYAYKSIPGMPQRAYAYKGIAETTSTRALS